MKKSKFSDTQIVSILKQTEDGVPVKQICVNTESALRVTSAQPAPGVQMEIKVR
jgi:hypothetical protein